VGRRGSAVLAAALVAVGAYAAGLEPVARTASLELLFDAATATLTVRELAAGVTWRSAPEPVPGAPALAPAQASLVASPFRLSYVNRAGTTALAADSFSPGVTSSVTRIENGVLVHYKLASSVPAGTIRFDLEYRLAGDAFDVRVPGDSIVEEGDLMVVSLQVLPFFGANPDRTGGGFVLPDGSGTLVAWRPPTGSFPVTFSLPLYGEEQSSFAVSGLRRFETREEAAALPVFGMVRGGRAMLGVAVAGAEQIRVRGTLAGYLVDLNRIGPEFIYRRPYLAFLSRTRTIQRYPLPISGGDRAVRYVFPGRGDWQAMAAAYRRVAGLPVTTPPAGGSPSVVVRVFCGIRAPSMIGSRLVVATTFAQAADIVRAVRATGVERFVLELVGWETGGYAGRLPRMRPPDAAFGGERGMRELAAACRSLGVPLFLEADWSVAVPGGPGFRARRDALRDQNGLPVTDGQGTFLVSPRAAVERFAGGDLAAFASWGVDGVAIRGIGQVLMGDYREGRSIGRSGSLDYLQQLEAMARKAGLRVLADGGNAYAAGAAEGLVNLPGTGSGFLFADRDVPLLQMSLAGARWLAGRPLNLAPDIRDAALTATAIGMVPTIELTAGDPVHLRGTGYDHLVRSRADEVLADIGDLLAAIDRETAEVAGRVMVGLSEPAAGVTVLTYEGGARLAVNRSAAPFSWDGRMVPAGGLAVAPAGGSR
jgi:hypothetical protein